MNKKIKQHLALLMSLVMLTSFFIPAFGETVPDEPSDTTIVQNDDEIEPEETSSESEDSGLPIDGDNEAITDVVETVEPRTDVECLEDVPESVEPAETEDEAPANSAKDGNPLKTAIKANGHAYVMATNSTNVYDTAEMTEDGLIYTITQNDAVLLATAYDQGNGFVKVWLVTEEQELVTGYVSESAIASILTDVEAGTLAVTLPTKWAATEAGECLAFAVAGEAIVCIPDYPVPGQVVADVPIDAQEQPITTEEAPQEVPVGVIEPMDTPVETEVPVETDVPVDTEEPLPLPPVFQAGDYVSVTHDTRVYLEIDETLEDGYNGDFYDGVFIGDAIVQVETVEQDSAGRYWCKVRYLYGDDFADGTLKWMEASTVYVLASELSQTDEQKLTLTDYAFPSPRSAVRMLMRASAMPGFSLKNISVYIPTFYSGQGGLYGSSGKDSAYLQIAKSSEHGTIYATPHYLDGFSVYCLEHNLSGPGENISGGGQEPTGPYMIVDIDSYRNNLGYSSIIYNAGTLQAIAWVIRHSYPFMALDRSDSDNETWSRVAGQFAIREVIKQMEGAQYVRSYWDMDNFYRASGQAPAVYLEYARWLAENGIARGRMTGNINVSGKSVTAVGGGYAGTVTLTTDADKMRIRRSVGSLTGNTAGSDGTYYYLNSGDTITITSASNSFSVLFGVHATGFARGNVPEAMPPPRQRAHVELPEQSGPKICRSSTMNRSKGEGRGTVGRDRG